MADAPEPGARRRARGFSLLELVIVIVLISVLIAVAIDRLLALKAVAERTAVEQIVGTMRSALVIRFAELAAGNRLPEAVKLVGSNPMLLLSERPHSYVGELFAPDPAEIPPGHWYFDTREKLLCYLVESADYFHSELAGPARLRFSIEPVFDDVNRNGRYDAGIDALRGFRLALLEPYDWNVRFKPLRAAER